MNKFSLYLKFFFIALILSSCSSKSDNDLTENFDNINNRIWVGENFWSIPLEDWEVKNGKLLSVGDKTNRRVNVITRRLEGDGDLTVKLRLGILNKTKKEGTAGVSIALNDKTDSSTKSICYYGKGINVGISTKGYIFIDEEKENLPQGFNLENVELTVKANSINKDIVLSVTDKSGLKSTIKVITNKDLKGLIAIVNNFAKTSKKRNKTSFWFDDFNISGSLVKSHQTDEFGPVLWTMYTLSKEKLKLSAQFPPIGKDDNKTAELQIKEGENWKTINKADIEMNAYTALFSLPWSKKENTDYRVKYIQKFKNGKTTSHFYNGTIRKEPENGKVKLGGLTCQMWTGYPYTPLVNNLTTANPDLLFFSGDQIYERNGGYSIHRRPKDKSIINYLGKWYMFGWAFADIMKDRPTVCLPDDHDVFQGNFWGNNGVSIKPGQNGGGYVQSPKMINVVHRTQTSHLPDAVDPDKIGDDISVYFTEMLYGGVSFAIVSDRMFKSCPDEVATWKGRSDHLKKKLKDMSILNKSGLEMFGDRQLKFLDRWSEDWKGSYMKVLLSQTIFANVATHHGSLGGYLYGDLDSGGWPRNGRNEVIKRLRKCNAFHVCGDQHLPSLVQYGIDDYRDGSWVFCTPAIYVGYQRRFHPDRLGWTVNNRPKHNLPNTGNYTDAFGNPSYVYAIGQYEDNTRAKNRYLIGNKTTSGFGLVTFNTNSRDIKIEAIKFMANLKEAPERVNNYPGWPKTINQFENSGVQKFKLPEVKCNTITNALVKVINKSTKDVVYSVRMKGDSITPTVNQKGVYMVKVLNPDNNNVISESEVKI